MASLEQLLHIEEDSQILQASGDFAGTAFIASAMCHFLQEKDMDNEFEEWMNDHIVSGHTKQYTPTPEYIVRGANNDH